VSLWCLYPVSIPSLCSMLFMVMFLSVLNSPDRMPLLSPRVRGEYIVKTGVSSLHLHELTLQNFQVEFVIRSKSGNGL
jgi:hypothetical protein